MNILNLQMSTLQVNSQTKMKTKKEVQEYRIKTRQIMISKTNWIKTVKINNILTDKLTYKLLKLLGH